MKNDELLILHGRLVAGETQLASKLVAELLPRLVAIVLATVPELHDRQDAEQACLEAMLRYLEAPGRYRPASAQLTTWLAHMARQYAQNLRRGQFRREVQEGEAAAKADEAAAVVASTQEDRLLAGMEWDNLRRHYADRLFKEPGDREIFALMSTGETEPLAHAQALGLRDDVEGQEQAALRLERMRGRIRRIGKENGA